MKVRYFDHEKKSVVSITTPYAFTLEKCHAYLELFLPTLHIDSNTLGRCKVVLDTILKYADDWERDDKVVVWKEFSCWEDTYEDVDRVDKIFMCLFHFNLGIVCVNPNVFGAYKHEYSLEQILSSDVYYKQFCDYWYNYDDLFKLVYDVQTYAG